MLNIDIILESQVLRGAGEVPSALNGGNKGQTADGDGKKGYWLINGRSWIRSNKGTEPKGQTLKSGSKKGGAGSICVLFLLSWAVSAAYEESPGRRGPGAALSPAGN